MVPLTNYEDFRPYIDRMVTNGERNLITNKNIRYFSLTSGTVSGRKLIPTAVFLMHFKSIVMLADDLYAAMKKRGLKRRYGKGFISSEFPVTNERDKSGKKIKIGVVTTYSIGKIKSLIPCLLAQPADTIINEEIGDMRYIKSRYALQDPDLIFIGGFFMTAMVDYVNYILRNKDLLIHDIETGKINPSVDISERLRRKLEKDLKPDPVRAAELREILDHPDDGPLVSRIWKDLCMIAAIGTGDFLQFTETMRSLVDDKVSFEFMQYASSENMFGAVMRLDDMSVLLFPDGGFYEFIPVGEDGYGSDEVDSDGNAELKQRPLLLNELEQGHLYEMVLTNKTGLYRYMIRDVVRVTGYENELPYLEFAYRANHVCNICNTHLTGDHLKAVIECLEERIGAHIEDYSIYSDLTEKPPIPEIFYETLHPTGCEDEEELRKFIDEKLREICWDYEFYRANNKIGLVRLTEVRPGTYMEYRDKQLREGNVSRNQLKALRIIANGEQYEYFRSRRVGSDRSADAVKCIEADKNTEADN